MAMDLRAASAVERPEYRLQSSLYPSHGRRRGTEMTDGDGGGLATREGLTILAEIFTIFTEHRRSEDD